MEKNLINLLEGMQQVMDTDKSVTVSINPKNLVNEVLGVRLGEMDISYPNTPLERLVNEKGLRGNEYVALTPENGEIYYYDNILTACNEAASLEFFGGITDIETAVACVFVLNGVGIVRLLTDVTVTNATQGIMTVGCVLDLNGFTLSVTDTYVEGLSDTLIYGMKEGSEISFNYTSTETSSASAAWLNGKTLRLYGGAYSVCSCGSFLNWCYVTSFEMRNASVNYQDNQSADLASNGLKRFIVTYQSEVINCNVSAACSVEGAKTRIIAFYCNFGNHRFVDTDINISTLHTSINKGIYASEYAQGLSLYNCNISVDDTSAASSGSIAVDTYVPTVLIDTNVTGVHSGIQSWNFLYIKGGCYQSIGHGGVYTAKGSTAHIEDARLVRMPDAEGRNIKNAHGGTYFGYGSRVFCNNVSFVNEATNRAMPAAFTVKQGDHTREITTKVYISNCSCSPALIRVDGDTWTDPANVASVKQRLYIGNNVKLIDTNTETVITNQNLETLINDGKFSGSGGFGTVYKCDYDKFKLFKTV